MSTYMINIARGGSFKVATWLADDQVQQVRVEITERVMDDAWVSMSVAQAQQLVADLVEAIAKIPEPT